MTRGRLILVLAIVIIGVVFGFRRWSDKDTKTVEVPPVGNNLEVSELEQGLKNSPDTSVPDVILENDSGRVEVRVSKEGEMTTYYLSGQLPPLEEGFYGVWVENQQMGDLVNLGKLSEEKGGWLLSFQTKGEVKGYETLIISRELRDDSKPELILFRGQLPEGR